MKVCFATFTHGFSLFFGVREFRFAPFRTHKIFSKEKKEKKKAIRPSGRFQKSKFFRKNTTRYVIEIGSV